MNEKQKTNPCDSFDVFLSHNSQDKPIVRELAEKLNSRNLRVWLDEEQLVPGRPWQKALETVIETIGAAAVLIGKTGLGPWEEPEMWACLNEFVRRGLPVIPVLLPGAPAIPKLPLFLQAFTWVDLRDGLTDSGLENLAWGITGIKSGQPSRPDKPPDGSGATLAALRTAILADAALPELDEKAIQAVKAHPPRHLEDYRLARIAEWSQPRYELNRRFTRLTLLVDQGPEAQGVRWQAQQSYDDLRKLLSEVGEPALVLLGPPGCGKSTLLRRLELDLAVESLRKPGEACLSLFLPLNRYRPVREGLPLPAPQEWLEQEWALRNHGQHLPVFAELLRGGRLILLLDAVNEMPHADAEGYRNAIAGWRRYLADLAVTAPGVRAVFSCRSLDYSASLSTPGFSVPHVRIERLDDAQVEEFLTLYNPGQGPALWQALRGTPQLDLFRSPFYLKLLLAQAGADGAAPQGRAALFTGFVRQALIREVEADNPLFRPGLWLDPWDHERIVRREQMQGYELAEDSPLFPALSGFAHRLQEKRGAAHEARIRVKRKEALQWLGGGRPEDALEAGVALQVLDIDGRDVLFVHQLFQEYFAARAIAAAPDTGLAKTAWGANEMSPSLHETLQALADSDPLPPAPATGWEETFLLATEMLDQPDAFIGDLAKVNLPLAGRCAAQVNALELSRHSGMDCRNLDCRDAANPSQQLRQQLLARSRDPAADLRARIAAAHALGELGDPRFQQCQGPQGVYLKPPLVPIKAGVYTIGSDERLYDDEAPAHAVQITGFSLAQFPITNAEWRCFQDAGGYDDEQWWETAEAKRWRRGEGTTEGPKQQQRENRQYIRDNPAQIQEWQRLGRITSTNLEYWEFLRTASDANFEAQLEQWYPPGRQTQPRYWDDPAYNAPTQPLVGVCWHEARAYCAWLTAQAGQTYRLPTEAEWEAAARGLPDSGKPRVYPWGGLFDSTRCNTFESHLRGTSPVGVFPGGDSPEGIADLSGNVWEWTGSLYQPYPYDGRDGRENAESAGRRVLRGGSWLFNQDYARCAYRLNLDPGYRNDYYGFRVVCCVSPPS